MKKSLKIISIILVTILVFTSFSYGFGVNDIEAKNPDDNSATKVKDVAGEVLGIIRTIGIVLSVVILILIGMKYMVGSVEEKAEYKRTLMPYLIGAFILFSGTTLPSIIYDLAKFLGQN